MIGFYDILHDLRLFTSGLRIPAFRQTNIAGQPGCRCSARFRQNRATLRVRRDTTRLRRTSK